MSATEHNPVFPPPTSIDIRPYSWPDNPNPKWRTTTRPKKNRTFPHDVKVATIHRLRINLKSLAAESRFIRQEISRAGFAYQYELHHHRVYVLRPQIRITHLALAFVRGVRYKSAELSNIHVGDVPYNKIVDKLKRCGFSVTPSEIIDWTRRGSIFLT